MDTQTKMEIRNSFAGDADNSLRTAEEQIQYALGHVEKYQMGCVTELKQCLEQLEIARKTLWMLQRTTDGVSRQ